LRNAADRPVNATPWGARAVRLYDDAYARRYREVDDTIRHGDVVEAFGRWLADLCRQCGPAIDVLDLGCGTGRYFWALEQARTLVGIDASRAMLGQARRPVDEAAIRIGSIELVEADFLMHDFAAGRFDLVYSIGVLAEHVPLTVELCARVRRWLKLGGRFGFTTVHPLSPSVPRTLARRLGEIALHSAPGPMRAWLRGRLVAGGMYADEQYVRDVMARSGLVVESIQRFTSEVHLHCLVVARAAAAGGVR
jgi:SAM-dependent methyltransferase